MPGIPVTAKVFAIGMPNESRSVQFDRKPAEKTAGKKISQAATFFDFFMLYSVISRTATNLLVISNDFFL
jgi:hypothetical protein